MNGDPESEIRRRVAESGSITFAEFMRIALYHAKGGYYSNASPFGAEGDYYTSPLVVPALAAALALACRALLLCGLSLSQPEPCIEFLNSDLSPHTLQVPMLTG